MRGGALRRRIGSNAKHTLLRSNISPPIMVLLLGVVGVLSAGNLD
jgi:hypothetical protein